MSKGYGWWYFTHSELRDEKAVLFATFLPKGTYEYTYTLRASVPGEYRVIPTTPSRCTSRSLWPERWWSV